MPHPSPSRFNLRYVTRSRATVDETSAGGLVVRRDDKAVQVALIARYDRRNRLVWSLPKGHVEEGETVEQAALREVLEETGLVASIVAPLGVIDFWFAVEDRRIHKTVHHFLMRYDSGVISDEDPEVVEVQWVDFEEVPARLAYRDERRLVAKARGMLGEV
ncbi:MAG: NUDIX hydrolase [Actinobacteria bacterium]|jgi:ADP-ribose pyrophosphatase YjhB (NUDIX family)|nr:NUDIX hydrolase [Micrococcales bacterium]MCB0904278.1 NUDIX hydrolase [Actinomycetota bacterium]MCO5299961.1 NUDIX hydrolase [Candidatus Nanopelagicales bacterium]MCB9429781.1 NUDIX hydrolase [Actinomycetota bacterium]HPE11942.1 NUDIX hydrolase [Actinomycetota bacterium]